MQIENNKPSITPAVSIHNAAQSALETLNYPLSELSDLSEDFQRNLKDARVSLANIVSNPPAEVNEYNKEAKRYSALLNKTVLGGMLPVVIGACAWVFGGMRRATKLSNEYIDTKRELDHETYSEQWSVGEKTK